MSGSQKETSFVQVSFSPDPGFELNFDGLHGTEELGRPFLYHLAMTAGEWKGNIESLVGAVAAIKWIGKSTEAAGAGDGATQGTGGQAADANADDHYLNGIVTRVVSQGLERGAYHYSIELRPWLWLLSRAEDCRIFQQMSPFDIIVKVLRDEGFTDFEDKRQSSSGDETLEYCVQYRESSFAFITRLMEQYGLYYFFRHTATTHTLVFCDDPNSHTELSDAVPFQFDQTEHRTVEDHIWEWTSDYSLHSGKYTMRDYNFKTPAADLTSKSIKSATHKYADYEVFEYPGPYDDTGVGQKLVDVRMQAVAADRAIFKGVSNSRLLHTGWKFKLSGHKASELNRAYLIVSTDLTAQIGEGMSSHDDEGEGEKRDTYRVTMHAVESDTNFRLHRRTVRPTMRGPQTAKVVGPSGEEIYTDEYGRVKVRFHWDRADTSDENRTCWIRVAQSWGGAGWGSIVIPRVGMEVVVEFLEGNPDRPLITGIVYNANQKVPYDLPGNATRTTFKSNSSKGGSGFNELRFEDKAGEEEVFFQAQKDYNKKVLNNETVSVKQDTTTTVEQGNRSVTVSQGNDSLTVSTGNHTITVSSGKSDISAPTSITLTSGGSSLKLSPSGVEISAPTVKVSGQTTTEVTSGASMTLNGGGSMSLTAGTIAIN